MGLARIRPLRRPFQRFYFAVLTVPLLFLAGLASQAGAETTEVECTSLRLQMQSEGYDNTCEIDSTSESPRAHTAGLQSEIRETTSALNAPIPFPTSAAPALPAPAPTFATPDSSVGLPPLTEEPKAAPLLF